MALFDSINQMQQSRKKTSRRLFLWGGISALLGYSGFRFWKFRARAAANRLTKYISTNQEFYSVAVDEGFRPKVNESNWKLEISSAGGKGISLSYDELRKLESHRIFKTFICVGNEVGGPFINNAEWTVTALAPLLKSAYGDNSSEGMRAVFYGLDDFYSSVPLEVALHSNAYIAYEMNGEKLPLRHGFPARVLLPGKYGMKQPRWLSKIEIVKTPWFKGYYELRGYSDAGAIKNTARIDYASKQEDGRWLITGIALCGAQAVGKVEISTDDGKNWKDAIITSERLPDSWATWKYEWKPEMKQEYIIAVRGLSESGEVQISQNGSSFPSGSSGYHRIVITV
jgi:DMSO/TMAO reductase YedYZ molybdopterin-dependent catalytic subunit